MSYRHCRTAWLIAVATIAPALGLPTASAELVTPVSATTDMGNLGFGDFPEHVRDQSGLSPGYTSGTTVSTYLASNPTHDSSAFTNNYASATDTTTGNFDLDLGGTFIISSMVFWNRGDNHPSNITGFTLLADNSATFPSPTTLGSFSPNPNTGPGTAVVPEVFSFPANSVSHIRMQITTVNGGDFAQFGELVFATIPEPSALLLMSAAGILGISGSVYRRYSCTSADAN